MNIGVKLKEVRTMTKKEIIQEGWEHDHHAKHTKVLVFDDGSVLYPSQDYEGNGSGVFFGYKKNKNKIEHFGI